MPRIVINPTTFKNNKDALCVAWNEGIRVFMEETGYEPESEPTAKQRKFFSDTAYADDEIQLRRTILARICTFDTSVKDPTDEQLSESVRVLRELVESGYAKTEDEVAKCERLARAIEAAVGAPVEPAPPALEPAPAEPLEPVEAAQAADQGGETKKDESTKLASTPANAEPSAGSTPAPTNAETSTEPTAAPTNSETSTEPTPAEGAPAPGEEATQDAGGKQTAPAAADAQAPESRGAYSNIWSGGEEGKGRQLTQAEAEFLARRINTGASTSREQQLMFANSVGGGMLNDIGKTVIRKTLKSMFPDGFEDPFGDVTPRT